jgi:DNA-binding CsgD family transcriptional regulator
MVDPATVPDRLLPLLPLVQPVTPQGRRVLEALAEGHRYAGAYSQLGLSQRNYYAEYDRLKVALGGRSVPDYLVLAIRSGQLRPTPDQERLVAYYRTLDPTSELRVVLQLTVRGLNTAEIARQIGRNEAKAYRLLRESYEWLGVRNIYAAAAIAAWGEDLQEPPPQATRCADIGAGRVGRLDEDELEIIGLFARGLSQPAAAAKLGLTTPSLRYRQRTIALKLGTNHTSQWVRMAVTSGRLPVPDDQLPLVFGFLTIPHQPAGQRIIRAIMAGASTFEELRRAIGVSASVLSCRIARVYRALGIQGVPCSDGPAHLIALVHWADALPD